MIVAECLLFFLIDSFNFIMIKFKTTNVSIDVN